MLTGHKLSNAPAGLQAVHQGQESEKNIKLAFVELVKGLISSSCLIHNL